MGIQSDFHEIYWRGFGRLCAKEPETELGRSRELVCRHSELAYTGNRFRELARCPAQVLNSCDQCCSFMPPYQFFWPVPRITDGDDF